MRVPLLGRLAAGIRGLRHADPVVRAVVIEGFFNRLGFGMVTFALPLYALELGMSTPRSVS